MLDEYLLGCDVDGAPDYDSAGNPLTGTAVYRFFDVNSDLLYVGTTNSISVRWNDHSAAKAWYADVHHMTVVWYQDTPTAEAVERHAIATEIPRYNVMHNPNPRKPERRVRRRRGPLSTPEAVKARAAYRRSLKAGQPLSDRELGKKYERSRTWGASRIREVEAGPQPLAAAGGAR